MEALTSILRCLCCGCFSSRSFDAQDLATDVHNAVTGVVPPSYDTIQEFTEILHRELNHPNYPFNFPRHTNPEIVLRNLMVAVLRLPEEDQNRLVQDPSFNDLYERALPVILKEVDQKTTDRERGLNRLLQDARPPAGVALYDFIQRNDANVGYHRLNMSHCFTREELVVYVGIIRLCTHNLLHYAPHAAQPIGSLVQIHLLLKSLQIPLEIYRLQNLTQNDLAYMGQLFSTRNIVPHIYFYTDPYQHIGEEITALHTQIVDARPPTDLLTKVKHIYQLLQLAPTVYPTIYQTLRQQQSIANEESLTKEIRKRQATHTRNHKNLPQLEKRLFAFILNYKNAARIQRIQEACLRRLEDIHKREVVGYDDVIRFRREIDPIRELAAKSYGSSSELLGLSREAAATCENVGIMANRTHAKLSHSAFTFAVNNATHRAQADRNQCTLWGLNLCKQLETPESGFDLSPSQSACGSIAAYAIYYEMWKNVVVHERRANSSEWRATADDLTRIIRIGTARYQVIQNVRIDGELRREGITQQNSETQPIIDAAFRKADETRPFLIYEEIMSREGFQGILARPNIAIVDDFSDHKRWKMTLRRNEEQGQYAEFLTRLANLLPNVHGRMNQMGAIINKGDRFFYAITMVRTSADSYSVTIMDSHGSSNEMHREHRGRAFKITFPSIADAATFLAIHYPSGMSQHVAGLDDQCTLYPVSIIEEDPPENVRERLESDASYVTRCSEAIEQEQDRRRRSWTWNHLD